MEFKQFIESVMVYHGSKTPIDRLDASKHLSGYYPGFYTFTDPEKCKDFGKFIYGIRINPSEFFELDNPKAADDLKKTARAAGVWTSEGSGWPEAKFLQSQGYKGIKRGMEYIIFEPDEIVRLEHAGGLYPENGDFVIVKTPILDAHHRPIPAATYMVMKSDDKPELYTLKHLPSGKIYTIYYTDLDQDIDAGKATVD